MSCNLIYITEGKKFAREIKSAEEYIKLRSNARHLQHLAEARKGDKKAKLKLTQFNYSGYFPTAQVKGKKLPSKAYVVDIDDKETFERVYPEVIKSNSCLMVERSVNGGGHIVCHRAEGKTILESQCYFSHVYECEIDTNAHDINRVLFATSASQEDLLYLNDALFGDTYNEAWAKAEAERLNDREKNGEEWLPEGAHSANKHFMASKVLKWGIGLNAKTPKIKASEANEQPSANEPKPNTATDTTYPNDYNGIPFSEIIDTYWQLHSDTGQSPTAGNRNTSYYELAYNLRHLCGFNPQWLNAVIPDYAFDADFGTEEKMQCITNAVNAKQTAMTHKIKDVLNVIREKHKFDPDVVAAVDEAAELDFTFFARKLPQLPMGLQDAADAVGESLTMPVLFASFPAIGALATGVRIAVHGMYNTINLMSYIAGDFASGKGSIDPIVGQWMESVKDEDKCYLEEERLWRLEARKNKNKKEQKEEPNNPIRVLTLNNTVANLADRLAKCQGLHAFSFTPEADTLAAKWKSGLSDFSVMLRQAYDGSSYEREAKSVDAVNVHIDRLLWNVVMCGTPDALFRVVNNYTDGFLSRIAIARTPDNTFAPLPENPQQLNDQGKNNIRLISDILRLFKGDLKLDALEECGKEWLDKVRIETMMDNDAVTARARVRTCITAQRMVACVILCATAQKMIEESSFSALEDKLKTNPTCWLSTAEKIGERKDFLKCFNIFADYMMENSMAYFHDRIEEAMNSKDYTGAVSGRKTRNKTIFASLPNTFTFGECYTIFKKNKGNTSEGAVKKALNRWINQGLCFMTDKATYRKSEGKEEEHE